MSSINCLTSTHIDHLNLDYLLLLVAYLPKCHLGVDTSADRSLSPSHSRPFTINAIFLGTNYELNQRHQNHDTMGRFWVEVGVQILSSTR
jgi:hypothetical protein